ncbi:MAG: phage major capsid protein, partial [Burkholderiales bacterium]|nr:phage major capsid protein [Burkholderiales bacterium]
KKTAKLYMSSGARDAVLTRLAASANGNDTLSLQSAVSRWAGYEVVLTPTLPSGANTDHAGRAVMLFGSLKQVSHFGDRRALELAWDSSFGFDRDQLTLRATTRFDIVHDLPKSTTVAGGVVGLVLNT